jgi:hypothetical protein
MTEKLEENLKDKTWDELCEIWYYVECKMKGSEERKFQLAKRRKEE